MSKSTIKFKTWVDLRQESVRSKLKTLQEEKKLLGEGGNLEIVVQNPPMTLSMARGEDTSKEDIVKGIANVMYNNDIKLEDLEAELVTKELLGEPKDKSRYLLLPIEM